MNDMRKLMETVAPLFEEQAFDILSSLEEYLGTTVSSEDVDAYSDGNSFAILYRPTEEYFLVSKNEEDEFELEDAEFASWPPSVHSHYGTQLRKITLESKKLLREFFIKSGWTVGEIFKEIFGGLAITGRTEDNEVNYLQSLGFDDAAREVLDLQTQILQVREDLKPYWKMRINDKQWISETESIAGPYLEASEAYEDEESYMEDVVPTIEFMIEHFDILAGVAEEYGQEGLDNISDIVGS